MPDPPKRGHDADPCPHFPHCVGCAFVGRAYGEQLRAKQERVAAALAAQGIEVQAARIIGSPRVFGYRNQAKLVVRRAAHGLLLGVYRPGTHEVVDISRCAVHHPLVAAALGRTRVVLEGLDVPAYDERSGDGWLRYLVVRASLWQRTTQLILVVRDRAYPRRRELVAALRRLRGVASVVFNENASPGNVIFGPRFQAATPIAALIDRLDALRLKSSAGSFVQANPQIARRIYQRVTALVEPRGDDVLVDLYCGVGAIALFAAPFVGRAYGIESSPHAVRDAKQNLRMNGVHNVQFREGAAGATFSELIGQLPRVDLVTLNPPRKGADAETRAAILTARPRRIVYVSCDPETLARDLAWLTARGYTLAGVEPFDMLPQTDHVECVAALYDRGVGVVRRGAPAD
jgi:23S rRNA (uracil1939-C5)-methyltransferase